jgi:glycosyltransferase involved in cell wall biosynthesis
LQALYYRDRRLRSELARLAGRRFDAVYAHLFRMGPYVLDRRLAGAHRIVDLTDVISGEIERSLPHRPALERRLYAHEAARISRYEAILALAVDETWVVSGEERQELVQRAPAADVRVVPNGVDGERFRPLPVEPVAGRLLFVGHMDVAHNLDAARFLVDELLPRICRQAPAATVRLVGAGGGRAIERLAARRGVEWAGFVPDLPAELAAAEVFVAPLRFSAGLQNKVLEAMAAARPVVTTPRVQAGLASVAGEHLLVGGDAESLVEAVLRLLRQPELRRRLGTAAREHVLSTFDWEPARGRLAAIEAQRSTELQPL